MIQIMIVSEKRPIMRQIVSCLEDKSLYELNMLLFSYNTVEQFLSVKPDILFLDTQTMVPYPFILEELSQCQWKYTLVLVGPEDQGHPDSVPTINIPYSNLNRTQILHAVNTLTSKQKKLLPEASISFVPDKYHIISLFPGADMVSVELPETILQEQMPPKADYILVPESGGGKTLLIRRSTVGVGTNLDHLANQLLRSSCRSGFVIYCPNVHWTAEKQSRQAIQAYQKYIYFLHGQCVPQERLQQIVPCEHDALKYTVSKIVEAALNGKSDVTEKLLRTLYIRILKHSLDFSAVQFVHLMLNNLIALQSQLLGLRVSQIVFSAATIEKDWDSIRLPLLDLTKKMAQKKLSPHVVAAVVIIFARYNQDLFLSSVADELMLNKIYFGRIFREQTGSTFLQMLQNLRMSVANELLWHSQAKVLEIAAQVGYPNVNFFSRQYKKVFGISPLTSRQLGHIPVEENI